MIDMWMRDNYHNTPPDAALTCWCSETASHLCFLNAAEAAADSRYFYFEKSRTGSLALFKVKDDRLASNMYALKKTSQLPPVPQTMEEIKKNKLAKDELHKCL